VFFPCISQVAISVHGGLDMNARCARVAEFHKFLDLRFDLANIRSIFQAVLVVCLLFLPVIPRSDPM
jgi:hypothetical protein